MFDKQSMLVKNEHAKSTRPFNSKFLVLVELVASEQELLENQLRVD